ncbi:MAG: hypothetical protein PHU56_03570 [Candidatus Pacebacteria bacterium]|nr:hypothetical protein [Candidatus Paceibacterota bacterium]
MRNYFLGERLDRLKPDESKKGPGRLDAAREKLAKYGPKRVIKREALNVVLLSSVNADERRRKAKFMRALKKEPDEQERKRKEAEFEAQAEERLHQRGLSREHEEERWNEFEIKSAAERDAFEKELQESLRGEDDEDRREELKKARRDEFKKAQEKSRKELEEELIGERESKEQPTAFMNKESHPVGFVQRDILARSIGKVLSAGGKISDVDWTSRAEEREKELAGLYKEQSEDAEKMSEDRKKEVKAKIKDLKDEGEKEARQTATALRTESLREIGDVIETFVDPRTKQEMFLRGKYEPIDLKFASGERDALEKHFKEEFNYSYKRTAKKLENPNKWWEESGFKPKSYEININPKKPSDRRMRSEKVRAKYAEKEAWVSTRIGEYAKSKKMTLELLKRMKGKLDSSLKNDPQARDLSTFFRKHPEAGQDWLKIKEIIKFQKDIEKSFALEVYLRRNTQKLWNATKRHLGDIAYRNFFDLFRSISGPLVRLSKKSLLTLKASDLGSLALQFSTAGFEFVGKEFFVSPARLAAEFSGAGIPAAQEGIRRSVKKRNIEKRAESINK